LSYWPTCTRVEGV